HLDRSGIRAAAIHGNKSQSVRQRTLAAFKSNRPPVLVATDIAARGLDVSGVSHVINYELPDVPEVYVHRIGRTGRAGATGIATTFCSRDERDQLRQIQRLTRNTTAVGQDTPEQPKNSPPAHHDQSKQDSHNSTAIRSRRRGTSRNAAVKPHRSKQRGQLATAGATSSSSARRRRRASKNRHSLSYGQQ